MDLLVNLLTGLQASYGQFFSLQALWGVISDPVSWGAIGSLVILEGLLSSDNALVLAILVKHLPKKQQRKALFYGIFGAYLFRFLAIGFGVYLIHIRWIKIIGALYLLWMSAKYFLSNKGSEDEDPAEELKEASSYTFWRTVLQVELMDITFSIDSILAAFGVSEKEWVLFLGAILGILMMRGVAQVFLALIEKYPELETTAYILIAIIGLKMFGNVFGFDLSEGVFFSILLLIFLATFVVHHLRKSIGKKDSKTMDQNTKHLFGK
ncbi:integral membrane protein, YkoY family [Desulfosporosinus orientis DSM 765]|uniref:Integral membrane protein, YkoY family n=1 Tax=Desulfosporosinus orientis (strain ATCC 19365 / DSM 765 / NCIMB 8382 / VKM B-1628 / Singapore I) TaxID=768706 RepID=G7WCD2_DESOD|nr:TerC family protein [Desulfosporosinus orientis]AET66254.1 integral membrane protein, YkoY family [Desulfosporosinus orientis DSM 765]